MELAHRTLARRAAAESFVLLRNEHRTLPLAPGRIALYGIGVRRTVKGGLGSGSVSERYSVTIEQGPCPCRLYGHHNAMAERL
jgi:beta-glucosidase